jgi:imidazolonepropionase-like amidohydrolase
MRLRLALVIILGVVILAAAQGRAPDLALVGARIYLSPGAPPIDNGTILLRGALIAAVGPSSKVKIPRDTKVIDCKGLFVTAGFWNSHVHILLPVLLHADQRPSAEITSQLEAMLTRWGFTSVFDLGSVLRNTVLIRNRIASGEVTGPRILTAGEPFWIKGGTPIYVRGFLEANHISMPEVESIEQATKRVDEQVSGGADAIKIFANSIEQDAVLTMPLNLAQAIVVQAHRSGKPVFAHVSNNQGIEVALDSGVDILAHTTPMDEAWSPAFARRMVAANMALTPTLTLWEVEGKKGNATPGAIEQGMQRAAGQLNVFRQAGGDVLFGTDVGYISEFDTSEEFKWMSRAGMNFQQILAALTTNPAERFGYSKHCGRVMKGMDGDLVVLSADPERDATAFSKVRYTIRGGRAIYSGN